MTGRSRNYLTYKLLSCKLNLVAETSRSLQTEIKQQRPFASRAQEGAVAILRTADVVRRRVAVALESREITPQQYNVLRILRGAGPDGLPTLEIADRMVERAPGITGLLDRLEVKELIGRERSAEDRRSVLCRITKRGLGLLADLDAPVDAADRALFGTLSVADLDRLLRLLQTIRSGAG
jgi:MarR family transcriptional regulator, organic hydroperoxide resistance regulator